MLICSAPPAEAAAASTSPGGKSATASKVSPASGNPDQTAAPDPWDGLRVGSHVVAKYWYGNGDANGWWIAVITAIDGSDFIIRWPDEPRTPPLKVERKHVAILHADFDVTREWERRR